MTWTVLIPGHTARLNQLLGSWKRASRLKKRDRELVGMACRLAGVPPALGKRRVTLTVVLGPRMKGGDPDGWWKSLLDALVLCKALASDRKECVELMPVRYERGGRAEMRVGLEDL